MGYIIDLGMQQGPFPTKPFLSGPWSITALPRNCSFWREGESDLLACLNTWKDRNPPPHPGKDRQTKRTENTTFSRTLYMVSREKWIICGVTVYDKRIYQLRMSCEVNNYESTYGGLIVVSTFKGIPAVPPSPCTDGFTLRREFCYKAFTNKKELGGGGSGL